MHAKLRTGNASRHGAWLWCPREQEHHRHPYFARNLSRSFFETPQKRCNSNDANSMFEQAAGELRAKLMGGGGAWPGFKATRRAKLAARTASGRDAAHGAARPHWCGGRRRGRRAWPRCRWAAAGPGRASPSDTSAAGVEGAGGTGVHGRASRSTTPSRRLACGDLAGGRARRRPEHQRRLEHQRRHRQQKPRNLKRSRGPVAEDGGFEPPRACTQHAFQACAIGH